MESPSPVEVISIEVPDAVYRKNLQNLPIFASSRSGYLEEADQLREKLFSVIADNGNKLVTPVKTAYPGQAKQIITSETGESQILGEVGSPDKEKNSCDDKEKHMCDDEEKNSWDDYEKNLCDDNEKNLCDDNEKNSRDDKEKNSCDDNEGSRVLKEDVGERTEGLVDDSREEVEDRRVDKVNDVEEKSDNTKGKDAEEGVADAGNPIEVEEGNKLVVDARDPEKVISRSGEGLQGFCEVVLSSVEESLGGGSGGTLSESVLSNAGSSPDDEVGSKEVEKMSDDLELVTRNGSEESQEGTLKDFSENLESQVDQSSSVEGHLGEKKPMESNEVNSGCKKNSSGDDESREVDFKEGKEPCDGDGGLEEEKPIDEARSLRSEEKVSSVGVEVEDKGDRPRLAEETQLGVGEDAEEGEPGVAEASNVDPGPEGVEENQDPGAENLDIDGKYLKSLVNLRKSPKKLKQVFEFRPNDFATERGLPRSSRKRLEKMSASFEIQEDDHEGLAEAIGEKAASVSEIGKSRKREGTLQGSLDSINANESAKEARYSKSLETVTKKSKSYEFIKSDLSKSTSVYETFEISYHDSLKLKSDSTSRLVTAPNFDMPSEEFCSECCYGNDPSIAEDTLNQETFYTLKSTGSSPCEDSTQCDICNVCHLQGSGEVLDYKVGIVDEEEVCELCQICADPGAYPDVAGTSILGTLPEVEDKRSGIIRSLPLSLPKEATEVKLDGSPEEKFEIENLGLEVEDPKKCQTLQNVNATSKEEITLIESSSEVGISSIRTRKSSASRRPPRKELSKSDVLVDRFRRTRESRVKEKFLRSSSESVRVLRQSLPKDEVSLLTRATGGAEKKGSSIGRKGSLTGRNVAEGSRENRRYSSVDNLQYNRRQEISAISEKYFRSKGDGLIGSADNIRKDTSRTKKRRPLLKSADDLGHLDSSTDNLDSLEEAESSISDPRKIRDSDVVRMVLTKHGIKIISDKETAL